MHITQHSPTNSENQWPVAVNKFVKGRWVLHRFIPGEQSGVVGLAVTAQEASHCRQRPDRLIGHGIPLRYCTGGGDSTKE
jgi:hypothetical protein